jgi:hypothetical protein
MISDLSSSALPLAPLDENSAEPLDEPADADILRRYTAR